MGNKKEYDLIEAIEAIGSQVAPEVDVVDVRIVEFCKILRTLPYVKEIRGENMMVEKKQKISKVAAIFLIVMTVLSFANLIRIEIENMQLLLKW